MVPISSGVPARPAGDMVREESDAVPSDVDDLVPATGPLRAPVESRSLRG